MHVTFTVGELVSCSVLAFANKTTKLHVRNYVTMRIVHASNNYTIVPFLYVYMCRDYLQCQKQTICIITTCVCTIHYHIYISIAVCKYHILISVQRLNIEVS